MESVQIPNVRNSIKSRASWPVLGRTQAARGAHLAWKDARVGALLPDQLVFYTEHSEVISGKT